MGHRTVVTFSGTPSISLSLSAFLTAGDHLLVIDTVYRSTRRFCDDVLTAMGVEVSYFDPGVGSDIVAQIRPNTRAIFLETPGSLTFRSEEHTSELQSLMRISYAVFCLKKKTTK